MILQELKKPNVTSKNRYDIHTLSSDADDSADDVEKTIAIIKANCGKMLAAYQQSGRVLYRGVSKAKDDIIITGIRPDRKPVQMSRQKHEAINNWMTSLGLKVTRGNCIFTSPDDDIASDWGNVYVIFVKDGWTAQVYDGLKGSDYSFAHMRSVGESLLLIDSLKKELKSKDTGELRRGWIPDFIKRQSENIEKTLRSIKPREFSDTTSLAKALKMRYGEMLIVGDSFIGVKKNYFDAKFKVALGIKKT